MSIIDISNYQNIEKIKAEEVRASGLGDALEPLFDNFDGASPDYVLAALGVAIAHSMMAMTNEKDLSKGMSALEDVRLSVIAALKENGWEYNETS